MRGHVSLFAVVLMFSACATVPNGPVYLPTVPPRPVLEVAPRAVEQDGRAFVLVDRRDWIAISRWTLILEHELKAACLALGGARDACRAD